MNKSVVIFAIGNILLVLAGCMFVPLLVSLADPPEARGDEVMAFGLTLITTALTGFALRASTRRRRHDIGHTEGFAIVSLGWATVAAFGCLPFLIYGTCSSFIDAYFETISGFTTTGATILTDVEALPKGLLFWRSFSHWLGGMGIVLLAVAILPALGAGGAQLFKAEVPGIAGERLTPRIAETAKMLWKVYLLLTLLEILALMLGPMDLFDAACHTFGTMATGGFSTKNASIGHYDSAYVDWVLIVFMFLAGCNFVLHFHLLAGRFRIVHRNGELRFYLGLLLAVTALLTLFLALSPSEAFRDGQRDASYDSLETTIRHASFQAVSIVTTTGYGTADFDAWPDFCRLLLLVMMFVGGCSGSTGGSMKVGRVMVLFKFGLREIWRIIRPHAVYPIRLEGKAVEPTLVDNVVGFLLLFVTIFVVGTLAVLVVESVAQPADVEDPIDLVTAASSVAATLGNIGPGLGAVGPMENFAWFSQPTKALLCLLMLLGRLELYCVLVLFAPRVWRS